MINNIIIGIILGVLIYFLVVRYLILIIKYKYLKKENTEIKKSLYDLNDTVNKIIGEYNFNKLDSYDKKQQDFFIDDILDEIAERGINNISKDKLEFLKNIKDADN